MEAHAEASSDEDVTNKDGRKRKVRRKRKFVRNLTSYSDSSESNRNSDDEEEEKQDSSRDLKYTLSQAPQSFSEIFREAQSTLRQTALEVLQAEQNPEELPNVDWSSSQESKHRKSKKKSKKGKSGERKRSGTNSAMAFSSAAITNGTEKSDQVNGTPSQLSSVEISSAYLSIADMDTDTELNFEEMNQPSTSTSSSSKTRNGPSEDVIVLSSDDDTSAALKLSFMARNSLDDSHGGGNDSSDSVVVVSSRSPSPDVVCSVPPLAIKRHDDAFLMRIRIRYRTELYEFDGSLDWDMERVREKLSEVTNVPESELLIYTEDDQKMVDGKSLRYYKVESGDILEALRRNREQPVISQEVVCLKFQKEGLKKPLCLSVPKFSSLKEIRTSVASILKAEEKKLFFTIDGETVDLCKTPDELDLEDDICVDIFERKK